VPNRTDGGDVLKAAPHQYRHFLSIRNHQFLQVPTDEQLWRQGLPDIIFSLTALNLFKYKSLLGRFGKNIEFGLKGACFST